jgi:hypothetical protein
MTSIYTSSDNSIVPDEIKILNLAIGVSDNTNSNLNFNTNQYLVVGEQNHIKNNLNQNIYSLLVDNQGVGINTSYSRSNNNTTSALYVDGDIFFTGKLMGSYVTQLVGSNYSLSNNPWFNISTDFNNGLGNIYYAGNTTIGNYTAAFGNCNAFNIVKSGKGNISNAQFSLQNLQNSQYRTAILGSAQLSPIIMNTSPGSGPIEFHMSRDQTYFNNYYNNGINIPDYSTTNVLNAPHLLIDSVGNVGIHTTLIRPISYNVRTAFGNPLNPSSNLVTNPMQLHIEGALYASNILTLDYLDQNIKHLDDIYIRRFGVSIPTIQIMGGQFGNGDFIFPSNVYINGSERINKDLTILGSANLSNSAYISNDLSIGGSIYLNSSTATYSLVTSNEIFCCNSYTNSTINNIFNINKTGNITVGASNTSNQNSRMMIVSSNNTTLDPHTPSSNVPVVLGVQQLGLFGNIAHLYNYSNEGVIINNVGYVGINTLFPQSNLHVHGSFLLEGPGNFTQGVYVSDKIEIFGNAITHGNNITDSDRRIKKDLTQIDNALDKVKQLTGYTFTNIQNGNRNTGLVAQDVQNILPEAVYTEGEYLGLAYGNLMGLIVEAIKDLSNEIDVLKNKV